jgi:hypothetical protein
VTVAGGRDERHLDPGIRLVLEEIRDLRREARDDRRRADAAARTERRRADAAARMERRRAEAHRRQAEADRRQAEADRRQAEADRQRAEADRRQADLDRRRSDERFEQVIAGFRRDSLRRDAAMQKALEATQTAFRDIRSVGLSIVKTLNRHTRYLEHHGRILERIDRKLGSWGNGPGQANGRTA